MKMIRQFLARRRLAAIIRDNRDRLAVERARRQPNGQFKRRVAG